MIVYVETTFVLELAYLQEQHDTCTEILSMARASAIELVLPAFSIAESHESHFTRTRKRNDFQRMLGGELQELKRSSPYSGVEVEFAGMIGKLVESIERQNQELDDVLRRILAVARSIPLEAEVLERAIKSRRLGLKPKDAIVFASVLSHLDHAKGGPKCFVTKDKDFFGDPDISKMLSDLDCKLILSFVPGLAYIQSQTGTGKP